MSRMGLVAFVLLGLLGAPVRADEKPLSLQEWAKKSQGKFPYSVAFKTQKAGYVIEEWKLGKHKGADVLLSSSEWFTETLFDGEKSVRKDKSLVCYELSGQGTILYAEVKRTEDGKDTDRRIERSGKGLKITTLQGDRKL